ncbi:MAG: DUF6587 family protein [Pseudomonadota bacterium]
MVQNLVVALIVVLALLHALSKYLPAAWREQIVYALARRGVDQAKAAKWLHTEASCGSGCASCKSCATPEPAAPTGHRVIKLHQRP